MIVVAILGILAAIAIPTYVNFRHRARASEARGNLGAIRSSEISYFSEWSVYIGNQAYTPDRTLTPDVHLPWDGNTRFSLLGYAPEGEVYFSYSLDGADFSGSSFTSWAKSDLDNDGNWSYYSLSSSSTEVFHSGGTF